MKELGLEIINKIYDYGYIAYIVGGFIRDMYLNIESNDVDITTSATPMELKNIFPDALITSESYGSVTLVYKNARFDVTTFRKEEEYLDNRHPSSVTYVNDLETDLLRRDFTVNALCMDKNGNIIDLINGKDDIEKRILNTIIDADTSFNRDALRILRAIRFATLLDFTMSDDIIKAIDNNKELLRNISYNRKKMELDKIFASNKAKEGIKLIKEFGLDTYLDINLERIKDYSDLVGIWAMINPNDYPFSSSEKDLIKKVNMVYEMDNLDSEILYKYGLYVNVLAGVNKGIKKKDILEKYTNLPIKTKDDINITANDICNLLKKDPGSFIGKIYQDLEKKIINNELENNFDKIKEYILENSYE